MQPGSLEEMHPPSTPFYPLTRPYIPLHTLTHPHAPVHTHTHPYPPLHTRTVHPCRRVQLLSLEVAKANAAEWVEKLAAWEGATHLVPV